ncbi:MAG: cytochrome c oxidase accessory protein CcoG [Cytophagales bacterium]|nr:cytochrome c oxidase accessory protein CcoG [Cytophagales bacterium]
MDTNSNFRDKLSTVSDKGERVWIYPKKPSGRFHKYRVLVSILLLIFMVGAPFVKVNGVPLIMFNIIERRFILFGQIFWSQDFFLFAIILITSIVLLILFTVIYGRIFCGWLCPQTIFMEMVFRKIEYLFEGDYKKQERLDRQNWNVEKVLRKGGKHLTFALLAVLISNLFLSYIIGVDELLKIIQEPISEHITGFISIVLFSIAFYWVFAYFREQVCTIACPYGRLQGVMLDDDSLVVAYNHKRGEPREKLRKNNTRTAGDCIDCKQCVFVCPTGIDIRNGTQLECINCTACIDECDSIMDRIGKSRGLIGFNSENNIQEKKAFTINKRVIAYSVLLVCLMAFVGFIYTLRKDIDITVLKQRGHLYEQLQNGHIRNVYEVTILNKTFDKQIITIQTADTLNYEVIMVGGEALLAPQEARKIILLIDRKAQGANKMKLEVPMEFYADSKLIEKDKINFLTVLGK